MIFLAIKMQAPVKYSIERHLDQTTKTNVSCEQSSLWIRKLIFLFSFQLNCWNAVHNDEPFVVRIKDTFVRAFALIPSVLFGSFLSLSLPCVYHHTRQQRHSKLRSRENRCNVCIFIPVIVSLSLPMRILRLLTSSANVTPISKSFRVHTNIKRGKSTESNWNTDSLAAFLY